ncbi:penicillin-binding protein activator [Salinisphaera sp. Q1T1-3]|uniref:penicillin-binding protein activator n=1 Tax=Salinisphaera sp. Q1T1-3 TaxID=2321229 RepID=UPI001314557B|nr:penicillin-binding protein activator [Salinisphaera sp. Q1T1-3]
MSARMQSLRGAFAAVFILVLAGCATSSMSPSGGMGQSPIDAARTAAAQGDYNRAAQLYSQAAVNARQPEAQRSYRLEAGLAAAQAGDAQTARRMLGNIDPGTLSDVDHARYNLAQREIAIADLPPGEALSHLPPPARNTAPAVAERVWGKRASLQFANNNIVAGIKALVQRDAWLDDNAAMRANDERIYDKASDAIGLGIGPDSPDAANADQTTRGWLALANIGETQYSSADARDKALAQWQQDYPGHAANRDVLPRRFNYDNTMSVTPTERGMPQGGPGNAQVSAPNGQVALALPMGGQFQNAAQAIRDGFEFAYQNNSAGLPKPLFYDSSNQGASALAQRATSDNIGVLVGPLDKSKVGAMAGQSLSIPEIALNTIDQPVARNGFYQFGLDPADEAASAARHALDKGYQNALVLVPRGDWGDRVLDGFRKTFNGEGGRLVDYRSYDGSAHDHSQAIQQLLGNGNQRAADFIFVAAQPTQARLIRSQLKYYHAADLPMVSTSHSFSGQVDPGSDIDLDGVYFVDMPWLLGSGGTIERLRREAASAYGDEATSYARLFAMGMDAWVLARRAAQGDLTAGQPLEGMTGVLKPEQSGHITRYLGWAVFRNGRPQTLSMPGLSDARNTPNFATGTGKAESSSTPASGNNGAPMSERDSYAPDSDNGAGDQWSSGARN